MAEKKLGVQDDLIYSPEIYDGFNTFTHDVPFYLRLARLAGGPALELCCGTGRLTLPLLKAGVDVTGLDFTPAMLAAARRKAARQGLGGKFLNGDMRRARLGRKFGLVFIPFNSLQNTYSITDVERVLATVRAHLRPGGLFAFDIFNPDLGFMVRGEKLRRGDIRFTLPDGRKVVIDEVCSYDAARQTNRVTWIHHVGNARPRARRLDMRCFYPLEMDALLKYNGFRVVRKYGWYDRRPFRSDSKKQIYVCRAA